ncbi:multiple organellar RNA editing factor 2, chloroplastic-like [Trifolium pratense]|uniref:Uncharacterized protein n=1 Tax=Trifolium pratense TaxID=57577 RepID=A0ACB0I7S1_TRIPR|nr:multiple organellar RNA editing factor 2, chloroplastic-like [Trifolium pratense]CAJ2628104.1 unnamed protein product [Trifolium pratense]
MARAIASSFTRLSTQFTTRLLSTTTSGAAAALSKSSSISSRRFTVPMSQAILQSLSPAARFGGIRGDSTYSPLNSGSSPSNFNERPPNDMAPLFPGCDYNHWLIVMDGGGEGVTKQQMIDSYVQTLAKVLGSEEEAKKKIYNVSCERYYGFGCEIDEETSNKLEGLPGVLFVLPDSYVDPEYQDYGAELYVNGEIVQRSPERQRRVEPQPQRHNDRPRYNDKTKNVRRRENVR